MADETQSNRSPDSTFPSSGSAGASADSTPAASPSADASGASARELIENEPYLGPAWAVAMLILYLLKEAFPAEEYSLYWWVQIYIVGIVVVVTLFTLVKRHQFYDLQSEDEPFPHEVSVSTAALLQDPSYREAGNREVGNPEQNRSDSDTSRV